MAIFGKIFGDANERYTRSLEPLVEEINSHERELQSMTDEQLREVTAGVKERLKAGELLDDILPYAFAAVREASMRSIGKRHFDVQLVGGIVLHQGKIAEMRTGEGKTLVATLPLYLNALEEKGAHLVTPNDYLSRVGAGWMGPVYHALGISVGVITHDTSAVYDPSYTDPHQHADERLRHFQPCSRREAYQADITYGTNNEFGFDYLRDNLEYDPSTLRQRQHHYAIVDEVDSILIDEARTPLIISMPDQESGSLYQVFSRITPQMKEGVDYNLDEKMRAVSVTEEGIDKVERILKIGNIYEERGVRFVHHLEQALRAEALYQRDRDYVVRDGEVIIVDEFTGRLMPGRRWSEGLHQAVEAKEGVRIQQESRTLATITFQNYFRMYGKLAGMTGTAQTSAEEFHKVYNLEVITIPTHRPMVREDRADLVFQTERGKMQALVREIKTRHEQGQPILIGTVSIEKNERLGRMLEVEGVPHELLNAKNHEREALIIAEAGKRGAVTVATNLAGRGVDILLGGSPIHQNTDNPKDTDTYEAVKALGGLHVIGTERHEARRIDNQLRGRAGRQGDPGSSQFFVSFEDDLMRVFGSDKIKRMMSAFGIPEDEPIENRVISKAIESAQSKIEGFHFDARKHVLEYDDVLNKQRDAIYRMRRDILFSSEASAVFLRDQILEMMDEQIIRMVEFHTTESDISTWNLKEIFEGMKTIVAVPEHAEDELKSVGTGEGGDDEKREHIINWAQDIIRKEYDRREGEMGGERAREIERAVMLRSIDTLWMEHLDQMEHLRDSVRLRAYGQRDPLVEYKNEGSGLFRELQTAIRAEIATTLFKVGGTKIREDAPITQAQFHGAQALSSGAVLSGDSRIPASPGRPAFAQTTEGTDASVGRNDPCPCGSGKKYKKCHGKGN